MNNYSYTILRLKGIKQCLLQVQKLQPTHEFEGSNSRHICILTDHTTCDHETKADTKRLIRRALCGYYTLESWHRETIGHALSDEESFSVRLLWVSKLIKDCDKEIKRLSGARS